MNVVPSEGTLGDWPDMALRVALRDFTPKPYAPLTLIKIVTEEMLREGDGLYTGTATHAVRCKCLDDESRWTITDETAANRAEREDPTAALAWRQAWRAATEKTTLAQVRFRLLGWCARETLPSDALLDVRPVVSRETWGRALDLFDAIWFSMPTDRVGRWQMGGWK